MKTNAEKYPIDMDKCINEFVTDAKDEVVLEIMRTMVDAVNEAYEQGVQDGKAASSWKGKIKRLCAIVCRLRTANREINNPV